MFVRKHKSGVVFYTSSLLEDSGITHGFFTREGGVSCGDFASLNVSTARCDRNGNTDNVRNVAENYRIALSSLGISVEKAVAAKQVHSGTVLSVTQSDGGKGVKFDFPEMCGGDSLFLDKSVAEIDAVCVKTADCVPILLSSRDGKEVCAVHAGWRGTVADIVTRAAEKFSCEKGDILCAIGPCIGGCCYEVGHEVYEAAGELFASKGMEKLVDSMFTNLPSCSDGTKKMARLSEINKALLINYGIPAENIDVSGICTCCGGDEFFSHRKSGGFSGTFLSAIKRSQNDG